MHFNFLMKPTQLLLTLKLHLTTIAFYKFKGQSKAINLYQDNTIILKTNKGKLKFSLLRILKI